MTEQEIQHIVDQFFGADEDFIAFLDQRYGHRDYTILNKKYKRIAHKQTLEILQTMLRLTLQETLQSTENS